MDYGYQKTVRKSFQNIDDEIRKNLSVEGFGIITEIDLQKTFKEKLGLTYQKFRILGACNPELARKAIDYEREVGLLMPCNVIFWENEDKTVTISFVDAEKQLSCCDNVELLKIGKDVNLMLKRAIDLI